MLTSELPLSAVHSETSNGSNCQQIPRHKNIKDFYKYLSAPLLMTTFFRRWKLELVWREAKVEEDLFACERLAITSATTQWTLGLQATKLQLRCAIRAKLCRVSNPHVIQNMLTSTLNTHGHVSRGRFYMAGCGRPARRGVCGAGSHRHDQTSKCLLACQTLLWSIPLPFSESSGGGGRRAECVCVCVVGGR